MADVTMTYAALNKASTNVNKAKADLDSVIKNLDAVVSGLNGEWLGVSYNAFAQAWQESKPTMQNLAAAVEAFAPELKTTAENQHELEQRQGSAWEAKSF